MLQQEVTARGQEPCPVCAQPHSSLWQQAPDRLHGRKEKYILLRCQTCSLVWVSHPPKPAEMHVHYTDAYHKMISAGGQTSPRRWRERKATIHQYRRSGTLLDLGCSSGSFLESLRREPWQLYGIEMSPEVASAAQANSGAKVFVGDILEAPFRPESYDVITCFDVLEHLYEPRRVMEKVTEWLKPGGIFYVLVPNIESAEARVFRSYWCGLELPRHLFHYSPAALRYLMKSVGLEESSLVTRRNAYIGTNVRYLFDDFLPAFGISRTPLAYLDPPSLPWKAARKLIRMTALRFLLAVAPLAGSGEAIEAVFRKKDS